MSDDEQNTYNRDVMERNAVLSSVSYMPAAQRQAEIDKFYRGEYRVNQDLSDRWHTVAHHLPTGKRVLSIRGTHLSGTKADRNQDLATDVLVTLGIEGLSNRFKRSDRLARRLKDMYGDDLTLTGHSLGGTIAQELAYKHDLRSHAFASGASPVSARMKSIRLLHPENQRRRRRNKTYLVMPSSMNTGVDPISISNYLNPHTLTHWVKPKRLFKEDEGTLALHSIHQFTPTKAIM